VFLGYDFHVAGDETGLIEINTNAGGAMVNTLLARAQRTCCPWMVEASSMQGRLGPDDFEEAIVGMFRSEWRAAGGDRSLGTVAIVDREPQAQYLYPEFLLFQRLLRRHGIEAVVADPGELSFGKEGLHHGGTAIDLVYNRLTDFYLEEAASAALRSAYLHDAVVLTPHPQAHALYADKRRLAWLSDSEVLQALGVAEGRQELLLAAVPRTVPVTPQNAPELWAARLYQGQTTNFRTEGGGFAPVYPLADPGSLSAPQTAGAEYASYVFLLDAEGSVRPVPHALYVALASGEATGPQLAGRQVRVADWHVRLRGGEPQAIVSEWYGWARFDEGGRFDPAFGEGAGAHGRDPDNLDESAFPTNEERQRMMELLFPHAGE
jgi:hypothetical protein